MFKYINRMPPNSSANMQKQRYFFMLFMAEVTKENISGLMLLDNVIGFLNQNIKICFGKMHVKISSTKYWLFCAGPNVLKI